MLFHTIYRGGCVKRLYLYILLFSVIIIAVSGYLLYFVSSNSVFTVSDNIKPDTVTVIVDAGHGGFDGGAVADDGTNEKDINLQIALKLDAILKENGIKTVLTRSSDEALNNPDAKSIREKKVSDIRNRMKLINDTENSIFVSIHQNSYTSPKYWGTQVFYSSNTDESREIAQSIQSSVVTELQPDNTRQIKQCGSEVYLIYNARRPAVLAECGFMTNKEELEKLKTEDYQQRIAECIANGIIKYLQGS